MLFGHGDDYYQSTRAIISNFSSNVWHGADLSGIREHLYRRFDRLTRYPEPDAASLKRLLAQHYGVETSQLVVTNGSITAFYLLAQAWQGARSAIAVPSFAEYEDACRPHGHRLTFFPTKMGLSEIPLEEQDMCWLCNPNNPDGRLYTRAELLALLEANRQVLFVIDQAYADFVTTELLHPADVEAHSNLVLVQSISKAHNLPGLRIGYLVATPEIVTQVARFLIPWSVNAVAIEAGLFLTERGVPHSLDMSAYLEETQRLRTRLEALGGMDVWDTQTHFMLVRLRFGKASALKDYLAERHGILIRDASNFEGLDEHFFRIATQTPAENDRLVDAIGEWFQE